MPEQNTNMCAFEVGERFREKSSEIALRKHKEITLAQAERDFYDFCAEYEIDGSISDRAYTSHRLGRQHISAYDIYNMIDEMKRGLLGGKPRKIQTEEQRLIR